MLNFIYYPVSFIMWVWHKAFGYVFGESTFIAWALSVVFLVFTLRLILYKPFVGQVRSMRKMQTMAPEMQKLRKKYANDKQKLAAEMQKLQSENGANPLAGCLPVLVQVPVFIGLFHVLREFKPGKTENYFFGEAEVRSFIDSDLFGAKLGATLIQWNDQSPGLEDLGGGSITAQIIVMVPLMIMAGIFTHITARHSVARQAENQAAAPQAAIMNKLMLYVFPIGVVVGAPFLPLAILFYWVSNNLWTLGQQYLVYKRIDAEESEKREQAIASRNSLAPKPGQKPQVGQKPQTGLVADDAGTTSNGDAPSTGDASANGSGNGSAPAKKPGAKPVSAKRPGGGQGNRSGGGSRPQAARNKGRKRR
ncbi:MAG: membrane protein insertase YidC [Pseudonocardia sp.]|nr:membrane protein insertase YidC [Pseudonocardia sp.]